MLECKLAQGKGELFVEDVKAAPEPQSVLFYQWQVDDLVHFCTNNSNFSVLTVDTTFNLGDFFVTPMTYHLFLECIHTGKHPIMIGPMLVHQRMQFATFNYFASTFKLMCVTTCVKTYVKLLVLVLPLQFLQQIALKPLIPCLRNKWASRKHNGQNLCGKWKNWLMNNKTKLSAHCLEGAAIGCMRVLSI